MKARLTSRVLAIAATVYRPDAYMSLATWSLCGVMTDAGRRGGRGPGPPPARRWSARG
jgi:hypothetical protein